MASAAVSRRIKKAFGYPPLSEIGESQRREFHEALLASDDFEDLPGKWQAAILKAERNLPQLRASKTPEGGGLKPHHAPR